LGKGATLRGASCPRNFDLNVILLIKLRYRMANGKSEMGQQYGGE
jgi:hypothetical protein